MATIASVDVALTASSVDLRRGLDQAGRATRNYTNRASSAYRTLGRDINTLRNAFFGFVAVLGAGQFLNAVDELSTLADQSAISIERFSQLSTAFQQQGLSTQQLANVFRALNTRILMFGQGTGEASDAFRELGFTFEDLQRLSPEERIFALLDALAMIEDGSRRAALASRIFGEEVGPRLNRAASIGAAGLAALADQAAPINMEDVLNIRAFNDVLVRVQASLFSLAASLSPILNLIGPIIEAIANLAANNGPALIAIFGAISAVLLGPVIRSLGLTIRAFTALSGRLLTSARDFGLLVRAGMPTGNLFFNLSGRVANYAASLRGLSVLTSASVRGLNILAISLRGVGAAFRFALGPIGLLIIGIEAIIFAFTNWDLVVRVIINSFRRFINLNIALLNVVREFLGLEPWAMFELIPPPLEDAADAADTFSDALTTVMDTATMTDDALRNLLNTLFPLEAAQRTYFENVRLLGQAFDDGLITLEQYSEALDRLRMQYQEQRDGINGVTNELSSFESAIQNAMDITDELSDLGVRAFNGLSDALTDFITTGMADFRSFAASIIRDLIRIQIQRALAFAIGGGGGSIFGAFLGRQNGGPVNAGQPYIVGEAGPELFVPNNSGRIVSNDALAQGGGGTTINITAVDTQSFQEALARDPRFVSNLVQRGNRAQGAF